MKCTGIYVVWGKATGHWAWPYNAEALLKVLKPLLQYVLPNSVIFGLCAASKFSPVTSSGKYLKRCKVQQMYKFDNSSVTFWGMQTSG
jgi:hypothetical protein